MLNRSWVVAMDDPRSATFPRKSSMWHGSTTFIYYLVVDLPALLLCPRDVEFWPPGVAGRVRCSL